METFQIFTVGICIIVSLEILIAASTDQKSDDLNEAQTGGSLASLNNLETNVNRNRRRAPFSPFTGGRIRDLFDKFKFKTRRMSQTTPAPPRQSIMAVSSVLTKINEAVNIAGRLRSRSRSSIQEARRKLNQIGANLRRIRVSKQVAYFKEAGRVIHQRRSARSSSTGSHDQQLGKLAGIYGSAIERLIFFADKASRLNDFYEYDEWADAVLSLSSDGIDQILTSLHNMVIGGGIFNTKPIINVFIDSLPTSDKQFFDKVDAFANSLIELQGDGYVIWEIALGVKDKADSHVYSLAKQRLKQQDKEVYNPLRSPTIRDWPRDKYGLVRVRSTACPVGDWKTGQRHHDTEDRTSANSWSNPLHMDGSWGKNNMDWKFCMKTSSTGGPGWPNGKYCTFAKGGCPQGMNIGNLFWDDEDSSNKNSASGTLPDGSYNRNTRIYFCCKMTGSTVSEIKLPIQKPFFLFPLQGQGCQKVYKMTAREEYFHWDCEDSRNKNGRSMPHPKEGDGGKNMRVYMCYYERTKNF